MRDCLIRGHTRALALGLMCSALLLACGPSTPDELMSAARDAISEAEPRTAEIHLKNLLRDHPDHVEARRLLGEVLLAVGDPAGAENSLRRAIELGAPLSDVGLQLLGALMAQGKFSEVLEAIANEPDLPDAEQLTILLIQGKAHQGLGDARAAESAFRAALDSDPNSPVARSEFAGFLLDTGREAEAERLISAVLVTEPDFAPALVLRGIMDHAAGRYDDAEASFRKVLRSDGSHRKARLTALARLVETQLALGRVADADASADLVLAATPRDPVARYLKARVEFEKQDLDSAARRLQSLIADFPAYGPSYALLGNINLAEGNMEQAVMYLRTAINRNPSDQAALLLLAETYIGEGDLESARRLFDDKSAASASDGLFLASAGWLSLDRGQPELASDYFDRSEASDAQSVQELVGVSSIYLAAGEFERAVRVLDATSLDDPNGIHVRDYLLALIHLRRGNLAPARVAAARLVDAQPDAVWSQNLLGTIDMLSQDFAGARRSYQRALELQPDDVPTLLNLARVAAASNDMDEAGQLLRRVLDIDAREQTALVGLAQLAARRGNLDEARSWLSRGQETPVLLQLQGELFTTQERYRDAARVFSRAFELQPGGDLALKAYAAAARAGAPQPERELRQWVAQHPDDIQGNFVLGLVAQAAGDDDAALRHYEAILTVDPVHTSALNNLAGLYGQRGNPRALELASRAHDLQPDNPAIADTLGWLYVMNENADAALPLLEQATAGLPDNPEVRYHWAVAVAEARGDSERSLRELRNLLASDATFPSRADAQAYLARLERRAER